MATPSFATPYLGVLSTKRAAFCVLASLFALSSCGPNPEEEAAKRAAYFEESLARAGITRVPAEDYAFPPLVDAEDLEATRVASSLATEIPGKENLVYCATRKLVEPVQKLLAAGRMIESLPAGIVEELPPGSYRFHPGVPEGIPPLLDADSPLPTEDAKIGWHCRFHRGLPFKQAFERLESPLMFHSSSGDIEVASFGDRLFEEQAQEQTLRKAQIKIIDFQNEDDFIVQLKTLVTEDEFILAKVPPEPRLDATLEAVMRRVERDPLAGSEQCEIQDGEALVVPILTVNLREMLSVTPPGYQTIQFRLDEKGATLEGMTGYMGFGGADVLRQMIFDKPFLLYLKHKEAKEPYFVLWVENLEVLEAFSEESAGAE